MLTTKYNVDVIVEVKGKVILDVIHQYNKYMGCVYKFDQILHNEEKD